MPWRFHQGDSSQANPGPPPDGRGVSYVSELVPCKEREELGS
jgi:hypothetical protein